MESVDPVIGDVSIAALRAGGTAARDAVELLYRQYAGRLRSYYRRHGASAAQAEDWVQDSFVRVLRGVQGFRGEASQFPAWFWKLSRNTMLDAWRQDRGPHLNIDDAAEALALADPGADPEQDAATRSLEDSVRKGFRAFALVYPERAQCLSWIATDQMDVAGIAEVLGRSTGATREYLSQCRKKLRPFLEDCIDEQG